jgi:RNA polymerase sigma-70 factor (ECF subfamily)
MPVADTIWQQNEKEHPKEANRILIHSALKKLPSKHQVVLLLIDVQGLSYEETADILNTSPGTVGSRLHRARKMLRQKVEPLLKRRIQ